MDLGDNLNNEINKKFNKYKIPKKKKSFNQICFPKKYELQPPQIFLPVFAKSKYFKNLLIFHKIGSGKTCSSIRISEIFVSLHKKIIVILPASLKSNFRNEMRSLCVPDNKYITKENRKLLDVLLPSSKQYKQIIKDSDELIDKHYEIYSYNKFVDKYNKKKINLDNKVVVIDEVQNIVSEDSLWFQTIHKAITKAKHLKVILLSGTPIFDKPNEIPQILSLLKLPYEMPSGKLFFDTFINKRFKMKNKEMFNALTNGYISYYKGLPDYVFPTVSIKYIKCDMSPFQYSSYLTTFAKYDKENIIKKTNKRYQLFKTGDIFDISPEFFLGPRMVSNIAFPNKHTGEKGLKSLKNEALKLSNLHKYSIKFSKLIERLIKLTGTAFIYSNFKEYGGIKSLTKILDANGYKDVLKYGTGKNRYAIWSSDYNQQTRDNIKTIFNRFDNKDGKLIKFLIGSPAIKEGVSLLRVRQVHILEPYWNMSRIQQIIGRASRFCSHKDLDINKRKVNVYIYVATHPMEKETIDLHILRIAKRKEKLSNEFYKCLKENAIDCELNINVNNDGEEEKLRCEK